MPLLPQSDPASRGVKIVPSWVASADPLYLGFRDQDGGWLSPVQLTHNPCLSRRRGNRVPACHLLEQLQFWAAGLENVALL